MSLQDVQFYLQEPEAIRVQKLRTLQDEVIRLARLLETVEATPTGPGGGSGYDDAPYALYTGDARLSAGRVLQGGSGITVTLEPEGGITISMGGLSLDALPVLNPSVLLGRFSASTGTPQEITIGANLLLDPTTGVLSAVVPDIPEPVAPNTYFPSGW